MKSTAKRIHSKLKLHAQLKLQIKLPINFTRLGTFTSTTAKVGTKIIQERQLPNVSEQGSCSVQGLPHGNSTSVHMHKNIM